MGRSLLIFCIFILGASTSGAQGINWAELTWAEALEQSRTEKKFIYVQACVSWSEQCEALDSFTTTDESIGAFFNENFINLWMDMEDFPGVELAETYSVYAYPAMLFFDGNGELIHRRCGALTVSELKELGLAALGENTLKSMADRFEAGERSPRFLAEYSYLLDDACLDKQDFVDDYFTNLPQKEWSNAASWTMINLNVTDPYSEQFQYLMHYHDFFTINYGKDTVDQKVFNVLLDQFIAIYEGEDITLFATQALKSFLSDLDFGGKGELTSLVNLKIGDMQQNWPLFAQSARRVVEEQQVKDPAQLNEFAWKFYLFVEDTTHLATASQWMTEVVTRYPAATYLDTHASLLFKLGNREEAVAYAKKALQAAEYEMEDLLHFQLQLEKFESQK